MIRSGPLAGVLVIAIEQAVAGPLASRHLLDLGARVIKVERPGTGDFARHYDRQAGGLSSHFVWLNRGKESVELDLKSAADRTLLWRMIGSADVVLQNLAPGSLGRLGLDADTVRGRFPGLVYASISGYGETGPYADRKAYDLLIQSDVGLLSITGSPDEAAKSGIPVADIAAGMYTFAGVLAALLRRQATGLGSTVRVSLLEALAEWMGYPLTYAVGGGAGPGRSGARHATIAPYGPYPTSTGQQLFIAVQNDREWHAFCETVLADPALATDSRFATNSLRIANRPALEKLVTDVFRRLRPEQATELLDRAGIAYAQLREVDELTSHPQLTARRRWSQAATENGAIPQLVPPITWDGQVVGELPAVPSLGEHNEALRAEFGAEPESERQLGRFPRQVGPVGVAGAYFAASAGARVVGIDTLDERRRFAESNGIGYTTNPTSEDAAEAVRQATGGKGADVVLETSGSAAGRLLALDIAAIRGRVVCVGFADAATTLDIQATIIQKQLDVRGAWMFPITSLQELLDDAGLRGVSIKNLIPHSFPVTDAATAWRTFDKGSLGKTIIAWAE